MVTKMLFVVAVTLVSNICFAAKPTLDAKGNTEIHLAAENGWVPRMKLLLGMRSSLTTQEQVSFAKTTVTEIPQSINVKNKEGKAALHIAVKAVVVDDSLDLAQARKKGVVEALLAATNPAVDVNAKDGSGNTALHLLAYEQDDTLVNLLLACSRINPNVINNAGATALHYAAESSMRVTDALLSKGVDISIQDKDGMTPLHFAAFHCNYFTAQSLTKHSKFQEIKDIRDNAGKTAYDYAVQKKCKDVQDLLSGVPATFTDTSSSLKKAQSSPELKPSVKPAVAMSAYEMGEAAKSKKFDTESAWEEENVAIITQFMLDLDGYFDCLVKAAGVACSKASAATKGTVWEREKKKVRALYEEQRTIAHTLSNEAMATSFNLQRLEKGRKVLDTLTAYWKTLSATIDKKLEAFK